MENNNPTKTSILFVDDEEIIRRSFTRELQMEHFSVTAVADGSEAISTLQDEQFDLVITDLMMPGIDGFGVLKAVKHGTPQTSVIILTGYGDMSAAIDALRLGADDFALKPCAIEELVYRIRRCLEKQRLLQRLAAQNQQLEEEITRRGLIEQQLIESENRFRLALDASSNGVWDRDLRTGEVYFGENWHRTLGYDDTNEIRDFESFEKLLHPDDRDKVLALREAHAQGQTTRYEVEFRMRNNSGGWQWMLSRGQAVARDKEGRALRIIGTHTDVTRLKEVEDELKRAHAELEHRVLERTAELSQSNVALTVLLKKREEDKKLLGDQVLANAAHLLTPFLDRLKNSGLTEAQQVLAGILQANLDELTAPFANTFSSKLVRLTPAEIQVANLVKLGKRTKEIADILHLSPGTISIHRKNIRKKLEMTHQKSNLQTMLSLNQ
jgi:PAS domain S-box-containing protein